MRKQIGKLLACLLTLSLTSCGRWVAIRDIESDARAAHHIDPSWQMVSDESADAYAMLFYDPASEEYLASVYRKNPYFPQYAVFVTGVSGSGYADDAVGEAKVDVLEDTYVYFSRNLSGREMLSYTSVDGAVCTVDADGCPFIRCESGSDTAK